MENRDNVSEKENQSLAMEMLAEIKTQSKRWMIAFFVVLSLWACTIGGFVWFINQYEFESYTQDGSGYNNINTGEQGAVVNGAEVPENVEKER